MSAKLKLSLLEEKGDDGDDTTSITTRQFIPELHTFRFKSHYSVDKYLDSLTKEPSIGSILGQIHLVLKVHGWKRSSNKPWSPQDTAEKTTIIEPLPQSPSIHYFQFYPLIGFDASLIEGFIQSVVPEFNMMDAMLQYCKRYGDIHISKTFPSMRQAIANRREYDNNEKKVIKRSKKTSVNFEERLENRIGEVEDCCIYDNDEIVEVEEQEWREENESEDVKRERVLKENAEKKRRKRKEKRDRETQEKEFLDTVFPRIIPISLLPLFLSSLPLPSLHGATSLLYECELLEAQIRNQHALTVLETEQVESLALNRRYLSFLFQQSHFNGNRGDEDGLAAYERELYENEIFQLKLQFTDAMRQKK